MLSFEPLTPALGARVLGADLTGELSAKDFAAIYQAFLRHQVLLFPPQALSPESQVAFGCHFGELQVHVMAQYHADSQPELTYAHRWQPHELLVWDNRCVLHRATEFDLVRHGRVVRRCTGLGKVPH